MILRCSIFSSLFLLFFSFTSSWQHSFPSFIPCIPPFSSRPGPAAELGMTVGRLLGFRFLDSGDSQRQLILAAAGTYVHSHIVCNCFYAPVSSHHQLIGPSSVPSYPSQPTPFHFPIISLYRTTLNTGAGMTANFDTPFTGVFYAMEVRTWTRLSAHPHHVLHCF